jgi:hypothetical protein
LPEHDWRRNDFLIPDQLQAEETGGGKVVGIIGGLSRTEGTLKFFGNGRSSIREGTRV